jgi:hypothetical protein
MKSAPQNISLAPGFSPVLSACVALAVATAFRVFRKAAEAAEMICFESPTGLKPGANEKRNLSSSF